MPFTPDVSGKKLNSIQTWTIDSNTYLFSPIPFLKKEHLSF